MSQNFAFCKEETIPFSSLKSKDLSEKKKTNAQKYAISHLASGTRQSAVILCIVFSLRFKLKHWLQRIFSIKCAQMCRLQNNTETLFRVTKINTIALRVFGQEATTEVAVSAQEVFVRVKPWKIISSPGNCRASTVQPKS